MPATNFNQNLGIRIARQHRDGITIECRVRKELLNFAGVLHGGVTARSHLLRIGKTLCTARVDVFDEENRLAAVALVTYMLLNVRR